jgi:hypothetical protein
MLELKNYKLFFQFPEVHPDARLEIIFHRTLRIPDDGRTYPLPPSLGTFPIAHVDDYKEKVPEKWVKHGGVMTSLWQSEAMWLQFQSCHVPGHAHVWPFAIKVSTGKRSAVTGKPWSKTLREGDYLIIPEQRWLDGYVVEDGVIKQFIAAPLGMGVTAEEQITGKAEFGGLQLEVYPMSCAEYMKRWPKLPPRPAGMFNMRRSMLRSTSVKISEECGCAPDFEPDGVLGICDSDDSLSESSISNTTFTYNASAGPAAAAQSYSCSINMVNAVPDSNMFDQTLESSRSISSDPVAKGFVSPQAAIRPDMGLAPGGRMAQQVFADTYGVEVWDRNYHDRCFVHLSNSLAWKAITGKDAPTIPLSAADYSKYGFPWFETYSDAPMVKPQSKLASLKSAVQMSIETGVSVVFENESAQPKKVIHTKEQVRDGKWG